MADNKKSHPDFLNSIGFIIISVGIIFLGTVITIIQRDQKVASQHPNLTFHGIVQDETGTPIAGAIVSCTYAQLDYKGAIQSNVTDTTGKFSFTIERPGFKTFNYDVSKKGYYKKSGKKEDNDYMVITLSRVKNH